jgi:hypothetical protein
VAALRDSYRIFPGHKEADVFWDERLEPGYRWDPTLRRKLCRSAITLVILVPTYFASEYCSLEWGITERLSSERIPKDLDYTSFISIRLVPHEELNPPAQVGTIQLSEEFEKLMVWGREIKTHPKWLKMVMELRKLVFDRITQICKVDRDPSQWIKEEKLALEFESYEFTWPPDPPQPDPSFPKLHAVEKKL